jgi:predicted transposase YbfD/YdcC
LTADFPFARSLLVMRTKRTLKKTGTATTESHYYLSSLPPDSYSSAQWLDLIRGHWAGVEVRNHWRRDALLGEDGSRSRNPNLLANVALIRSALLAVLAEKFPEDPLLQVCERLASRPGRCLDLLGS